MTGLTGAGRSSGKREDRKVLGVRFALIPLSGHDPPEKLRWDTGDNGNASHRIM